MRVASSCVPTECLVLGPCLSVLALPLLPLAPPPPNCPSAHQLSCSEGLRADRCLQRAVRVLVLCLCPPRSRPSAWSVTSDWSSDGGNVCVCSGLELRKHDGLQRRRRKLLVRGRLWRHVRGLQHHDGRGQRLYCVRCRHLPSNKRNQDVHRSCHSSRLGPCI